MRAVGFALVLVMSSSALAQSVGVTFLKGEVQAGPEGKLEPLKLGARVLHGHVVKTGANGAVILSFPNESRLKVKEGTELKILAPANPQELSGVDLVVGAVFSLVRKASGHSFQVKTPTAVAGVRGTQFFTSHDGETARTWMCVKEGEVEMKKEDGKAVSVKAGMGVFVEKDKSIAPPRKYKWTENLNWNMDAAAGDVVDKTKIDNSYDILKKNYD